MDVQGKAWLFGDNVNTDQIIPTKYMLLTSMEEMSKYTFCNVRSEFADRVSHNDFIIAGENFGCGSAREQAPHALKTIGIAAIIAKSFHTTFYRNAINIGLICFSHADILDNVNENDRLHLEVQNAILTNVTQHLVIPLVPLSKVVKDITDAGGLVHYYLKYKSKEKL